MNVILYHYYLIFQNGNTSNVLNIKGIFNECISLTLLPDISKWNINRKLGKFLYIFNNCISLSSLPNNYKLTFNLNYVANTEDIFGECISLIENPNIINIKNSY